MRESGLPLLLSAGLLCTAAASAQSPVLDYDRLIPGWGATQESPLATRLLADGAIIVVFPSTIARFEEGDPTPILSPLAAPYGVMHAAIDGCGNVVVAAYEGSIDDSDVWVMKLDGRDGRALWEAPLVWNSAGTSPDQPAAVSFDEAGDVLLLATVYLGAAARTLKIGGVEGDVQWVSPPVPAFFTQAAMTVAAGDAFFCVRGTAPGQFVAWSVEGGTGALAWGPVFLGLGLAGGFTTALLDSAGNLILANGVAGTTTVVAMSASSGSILWGPLSLTGRATSAIFAADGDLVIGSVDAGSFTVARYLVSNGSPRGEKVFLDPTRDFVELAPASNGDVFLTGIFDSVGPEPAEDLGSARIGRDGAILWGPLIRTPAALERPWNLVDRNGNLIEIYRTNPQSPYGSELAVRQGIDGATIGMPVEIVAAPVHSGLRDARFLSNGDPIIAWTFQDTVQSSNFQSRVERFDRASGATLWSTQVLPDPNLGIDSNDDILLVTRPSQSSPALMKLDGSDGSIVWGPVLPFGNLPQQILVDSAGDFFVTYVIFTTMIVSKYSGANGAELVSANSPVFGTFALDGDDNLIVVGLQSTGAGDWATAKLSGSNLATLWGPVGYDRQGLLDRATHVEFFGNGDLLVAGTSTVAGGEIQMTAFRYQGSNGAAVWGPYHQGGTANTEAAPIDVAIDGAGNAFLAAKADNIGSEQDAIVTKLNGSNGVPLWGPIVVSGNPQFLDQSGALAIDAAGNPILAATRGTLLQDDDIALASFDGATGSVLWEVVYGDFAIEVPFDTSLSPAGLVLVGRSQRYGNFGYIRGTPLLLSYRFSLGIAAPDRDLLAICGAPFSEPLQAVNATGPATFALDAGSLPDGVTLSAAGLLFGMPAETGVFPMTVEVTDSSLATATRDIEIVVREDGSVAILATPVSDCTWSLSAPGGWTTYAWEPGGETTPSITVSPLHDTVYGVTVGDGSGCTVRGSILVRATRLFDPDCDAPGLVSISPTSGSHIGGTVVTFSGSGFHAAAQARIGRSPASTTFQSQSTLLVASPLLGPGFLFDAVVTNPDLGTTLLIDAFLADFFDVPQSHPFHDFVEALVRARVTAGCGGGFYCPDSAVTREQMAVFLLRSTEGPTYAPPVCTMPAFSDVPCSSLFAPWINELVARGVTVGCGGGNYCPADPVTREQMAVFLLRTLEGPTYTPPDCAMPTFSDVPCSSPFARWIEELVLRGITAGCGGGLYCPLLAVSRGQMAVFLTVTFAL